VSPPSKHHRPRGLLCCDGRCPNCLVGVGGVPNVRACTESVRPGMVVRAQHGWPSLEWDVPPIFDRLHRLLPGGFYMAPDCSPIMGEVLGIKGFYLDVGWGTYGFKAGPVSGRRMAELIATGRTPDLIKAFSITRCWEDRLVGEKAAAAVSH
jgi:glycine/D-amino acid oxidase-like deaminating enzyme